MTVGRNFPERLAGGRLHERFRAAVAHQRQQHQIGEIARSSTSGRPLRENEPCTVWRDREGTNGCRVLRQLLDWSSAIRCPLKQVGGSETRKRARTEDHTLSIVCPGDADLECGTKRQARKRFLMDEIPDPNVVFLIGDRKRDAGPIR
jgi:hypothetical protein